MAKAREYLFRQLKNLSPFMYFLLLIFPLHYQFTTGFCSAKQVERHLTAFSFVITDIIKNTKIEAIFAGKFQFHIQTKTNNAAFPGLCHPSYISKGG